MEGFQSCAVRSSWQACQRQVRFGLLSCAVSLSDKTGLLFKMKHYLANFCWFVCLHRLALGCCFHPSCYCQAVCHGAGAPHDARCWIFLFRVHILCSLQDLKFHLAPVPASAGPWLAVPERGASWRVSEALRKKSNFGMVFDLNSSCSPQRKR